MTTIPIHAVASLFPPMDDEQFAALVADIKEHGQRSPITMYQGQVIDGLHRLKACEQLDIAPRTEEWDGQGDLVAYVVSLNLKRRHLSTSQRAMIASKLAPLTPGQRTPNAAKPAFKTLAQPEAAALLNVSRESVQRARTVQESGNKELNDAVERGEVPVYKAARAIETTSDHEQQLAIARARPATSKYDPSKPRRTGQEVSTLDRVDRAIDTLETMAEIIAAALSSLNGDKRKTVWAERLRPIRQTLTRFITKCEGK